jgi:chromosome segregation ATPase
MCKFKEITMTCKRSFLRLLCLSTLILIPCSTFAAAPRGGRGATRRRRPPTKTPGPIKKAVEAVRPVVEPIVEKAKDITAKLVDTELSKTREKLKQVTADAQAQIAAIQQQTEKEKDELIAEKNKFEVALADAKVASGKKIADMEKALNEAMQAQTAAEAHVAPIIQQFTEIQRQLRDQQQTDVQIQNASQQLAADLEAKTRELADKAAELQTQTDLVAAKGGELQTEKADHTATKAQMQPLQAAKQAAENKVAALEAHKTALTAEYKTFEEQFEIIQRTFGEYQTDVVALAAAANAAQDEAVKTSEEAVKKVEEANKKVTDYETEIRELTTAFANWSSVDTALSELGGITAD